MTQSYRYGQSRADLMHDDLLARADGDLVGLFDLAFQLAYAHSAEAVGIEHVLHAMTSHPHARRLLEASGVDSGQLRAEAAHVFAESLPMATSRRLVEFVEIETDDDVTAALELAVSHAAAHGRPYASCGDLLELLFAFEPGDRALDGLISILHRAHAPTGHTRANDFVGSRGAASSDEIASLRKRVDALEHRVAEDAKRIVQMQRELSRQRDRLPDADDWRSQMQSLMASLDAQQRHQASGSAPVQASEAAAAPPPVKQASAKRFHLAMDDPIVDAPSIGPKLAERLREAHIKTIRDLVAADPGAIASLVSARQITADAVRDWQDQARLVMTIPCLRATHAELLVGAGFRTWEDVALADQATLLSSILRFASTREGQSVLRNGPPPDLAKIVRWMEFALESDPARAA